jgi:hypothetical protein
MDKGDFSLGSDPNRPNQLISTVFTTMKAYFDGDLTQILSPEEGAEPWEYHARAYLHLLKSPGRNEPDDRICSIEVILDQEVPLTGNLKAIVIPHTLWDNSKKAPWLEALHVNGVIVSPYSFVPGRHPEHYHSLLEAAVRDIYEQWNLL